MTRCKCSHNMSGHYERRGKWVCNNVACGCVKPRRDDKPWPPARHRDHYDPTPDPIERRPS